jgi:hypothetical protein
MLGREVVNVGCGLVERIRIRAPLARFHQQLDLLGVVRVDLAGDDLNMAAFVLIEPGHLAARVVERRCHLAHLRSYRQCVAYCANLRGY